MYLEDYTVVMTYLCYCGCSHCENIVRYKPVVVSSYCSSKAIELAELVLMEQHPNAKIVSAVLG